MENKTTDIIVAGSGIAGLGAAISAAEQRAKVTVLEKRDMIGGISVTGMGIFAVESRQQKLKNHPLTKEEAFQFFMDQTHWRADAKLVSRYINNSADTIAWLEDMGVTFSLIDINWGQHAFNQTGHLVNTPDGPQYRGGVTSYLIRAMVRRAEELGVTIVTNAELTDLVQEENHIRHAIVTLSDGSQHDYSVKAVVIATGGYASNPELLMAKDARILNKDYFMMHNIPLDGKGIELAWKMGAGCDGMCLQQGGFISGIDRHAYPKLPAVPHSNWLTGAAECPVLYVNKNGKRFINEALHSKTYKGNAIARQKDKAAYAIFDSAIIDDIEHGSGVQDVGYMKRDSHRIADLKNIIEKNAALNTPYVVMADSLNELAEKCGIPSDTFAATVEAYNAACDCGWDEEFKKDHRYLKPIRNGKYYALLLRLEGYGTVGGIRINEFGEACTDNDDVIPGLYAAGDAANNAVTWDYSLVYTLWGSTLGLAVNTGRFAGESAGIYVKGLD